MAAENEIHLTCRNCSTVYRLDPAKLEDGRMVRCHACRAEWYQLPPVDGTVPEPLDAPPEPPAPAAAEAPQGETPAGQPAQQPEWMIDDEPKDDLAFRPTNKGEFFLEDDMRVVPDTVMPDAAFPQKGNMPAQIITHQPMGMGAGAYGVFIFILLFCLTAAPLMLFRKQIVAHHPVLLTLYSAVGIRVDPPGQGLTFGSMLAENRIGKDSHTLAVSAKLSNGSDHELPYPSLRLTVQDAGGRPIKDWDFTPEKKMIKPGDTVPVTLTFDNPPDEGKIAQLTVTAD